MQPVKREWRSKLISIVAIGYSLFHVYTGIFGVFESMLQRSIHLTFALVLAFLYFTKGKKKFTVIDLVLALISILPVAHIIVNYNYFMNRFMYSGVDPLSFTDMALGITLTVVLTVATGRVMGWALTITSLLFIAYSLWGSFLPGMLYHRGLSVEYLIEVLYMYTEGIFGSVLGVSATFIALFVIFGAFMEKSGVGKFFIDFAIALTGKQYGGPAKVAVVASGIFGTISGSVAANVATTGAFTIPMMKKLGYRPHFAGAVEAAASTGGQLMPPIMGAAVFVMSELVGIPYIEICKYAAVPAILFYVAIYFGIHFEARKLDLKPLPKETQSEFKKVIFTGGHLFLPVFVVIAVLVAGYTPMLAALIGIFSILIVSSIKKETRMGIKDILQALESGGKGIVIIALACAAAGIIVGVVVMTGFAVRLSSLLLAISGGSLLPLLITTAIVGIILGMGLPTTPAYIIVAAILVPAMQKMGVLPIAAHLFVFYFAVASAITPPVAIGAYAAAGLAGSSPMKTAFTAVRLGMAAFIVPFLFVYSNELLLIGSIFNILMNVFFAVISITAIMAFNENWLLREATLMERIMLLVSSMTLIHKGITTDVIGLVLFGVVLVSQKYRKNFLIFNAGKVKIKFI